MNREKDAYMEARSYERAARAHEGAGELEAAGESWISYAELKERKGSYFLSMYGYFNAARVCDALKRWQKAAEYYEHSSSFAERLGEHALWAFFMNLACQMHEKAGNYDACKKHYETIGNFFYAMNNYFGAADAYEHAAEIMALAGEDISAYEVPIAAWQKNYEYWKEHGELDDAEWSLKRIESYRASQNGV
jgi:tetratricopeptide (TPR) repeat protein